MVSIIRKILNFISRPFFICLDMKKKKNNINISISEKKMENIVIINDNDDIQRNNDSYSPRFESPCSFFISKEREIENNSTPPSYTKKRPEKISFCSASQDLLDLDSPFITKKDLKMKNRDREQCMFRQNTIHDYSNSIKLERNLKIKKS